MLLSQTEEAKHEANKNTGSGESLGDKASHVGNVASNKVMNVVCCLPVCGVMPQSGALVRLRHVMT